MWLGVNDSSPLFYLSWIPEIVIDIEDVLEALSYYISKNGSRKNIPLSLKRGLAKVFGKSHELFNSYHSQKRGLTLHDAMKILHPKVNSYRQFQIRNLC